MTLKSKVVWNARDNQNIRKQIDVVFDRGLTGRVSRVVWFPHVHIHLLTVLIRPRLLSTLYKPETNEKLPQSYAPSAA